MTKENDSKCPKCVKEKDRYKIELQKKARKAYGVVKPDEYIKLREESQKSIYLEDTLKEKLYMEMHEGTLLIHYRCGCSACGFTFENKKEINILN